MPTVRNLLELVELVTGGAHSMLAVQHLLHQALAGSFLQLLALLSRWAGPQAQLQAGRSLFCARAVQLVHFHFGPSDFPAAQANLLNPAPQLPVLKPILSTGPAIAFHQERVILLIDTCCAN